ncbi:hypothetical protein DAI22_08g127300 [Oryza sativa Japonica Group]|nr:hypothetical protein DAI22_08g127300 [Oryza sativa Japonica Group]
MSTFKHGRSNDEAGNNQAEVTRMTYKRSSKQVTSATGSQQPSVSEPPEGTRMTYRRSSKQGTSAAGSQQPSVSEPPADRRMIWSKQSRR